MEDYECVEGWIIRERKYEREREVSRATVFALANGYMGTRGAGEEVPPNISGLKGTYINGIYDTPSGKLTEREFPNVQDWTYIFFLVDGERFSLDSGEILEYMRELNMREGVVRRRIRWRSSKGKIFELEVERFLSLKRIHLGIIKWKLRALQNVDIELHLGIDGGVNNRWADHFKRFKPRISEDEKYLETETYNPGYRIGVLCVDEVKMKEVSMLERRDATGERNVEGIYRVRMGKDGEITVIRWCGVFDSRFTEGNLEEECRRVVREAMLTGYEEIRREHSEAWEELWRDSDIVIEGDERAQIGIRFAIFHLLASAPRHSDKISIPARGLQGQDYYGSIFWDCEIFVLPLFIYTQPKIARNILRYRYHTLDGARRKARGLGFKGAYYAWQSQETGDEQCDLYVFKNPLTGEYIRSYFADEEIHISGDIVYACWQYYEATGDIEFWVDGGAEIAVEVARFYVSRASYNPKKDRYEFLSVLGPDEYHERVNNNAYTNLMAHKSIEIALKVLDILREERGEEYNKLLEKLNLTEEEIREWRRFISKLYIPEPDERGLIPQFDGYFDLEDISLEETRKRLVHPEMYPGGPLGPFQRTQNIKQADVVMQLYLFRERYSDEVKRTNWEYYERRTAHDSSLSPMAYSLVAVDIGLKEWAYKYFMHSLFIDLRGYGPHWNHGIHAAALGGAWQCVVRGFCQLDLRREGLVFRKHPILPEKWRSVKFCVWWHGRRVMFSIGKNSILLKPLNNEGMTNILLFKPY